MKIIILCVSLLVCSAGLVAQSSKMVKWDYSVKKIADKTYEVHMKANISDDFHIYAQNVGVDGPIKTTFTFEKNPLVTFSGDVKEVGNKIKKYESIWGGSVNYYENAVDFVQVVKLKGNVKIDLSGTVGFMVCDEKKCFPPSQVDIKVKVGG